MSQPNGILTEVRDLRKHFPVEYGLIRWGTPKVVKAVDGVSLTVFEGQTYALVGESGCGKTTTCRMLLRLEPPTSGTVLWQGQDVWRLRSEDLRDFRRGVQAVFQDPWSSMNPRMRAGAIVAEPLTMLGRLTGDEVRTRASALLDRVGLPTDSNDRFPHEFSGGQRQRLAIARALALNPKLIVLDEPVSSLDVSIRAEIMNLLKDLQEETGMSYLLIAHHLATVRYLSHRVAVMYLGRIVEEAASDELFDRPLHPYTKALLAAATPSRPHERETTALVSEDVPSPLDVPPGWRLSPALPASGGDLSCRGAGLDGGQTRSQGGLPRGPERDARPVSGLLDLSQRDSRDSATSASLASHNLVPFAGSDALGDSGFRRIKCR